MYEKPVTVPFELKSLQEDGTFEGIASVFGNIDHGNDVVEPGAFDEWLKEGGGSSRKVRLMDSHKVRIGVATVEKTSIGLKAVGKINLKKQSGLEAYSDLKFYQDNGMPMGMSIGYETKQAVPAAESPDRARHLKKVNLWEVTVTEFPMNEKAQVTSVKALRQLIDSVKADRAGGKKDFDSELREIQLWAAPYQMSSALSYALSEIRSDRDETIDAVALSRESIEQFMAEYLAMLPDYRALIQATTMEWMSRPGFEQKVGRVLSSANRTIVERCIKDLQALLDSATAESDEEKKAPPNREVKEEEQPAAADDRQPAVTALISEFKAVLK